MSNAIIPRIFGDDYQACVFWLKACELFQEHTNVSKVAYEYDEYKAFDDVVVFYDPYISDEFGNPIEADYYQVKFSVAHGDYFTYEDLTNPSFINASSISFLQRLYQTQQDNMRANRKFRFYLITTKHIHPNDPLKKLISNNGGEIRFKDLSKGGPKSEMGKLRKVWMEHLHLSSEKELYRVLQPLRIETSSDKLEKKLSILDTNLICSGLKPVEKSKQTHPYFDLIRSLLKKQQKEFTKKTLQKWCQNEGLWVGFNRPHSSTQIGIRSFYRWAGNMEHETERMICLGKYFQDRYITDTSKWEEKIVPEVFTFLSSLNPDKMYDLQLDSHCSIAYLAGYFLDSKSGINIAPVQKSGKGKEVWRPNDLQTEQDYLTWTESETIVDSQDTDVALAISVRHDITADVMHYIQQISIPASRILSFHVGNRPSAMAVKDGTHACLLADQIASRVGKRTFEERQGRLHIFFAGPNGLMFFLGQHGRGFGASTLYEYDFNTRLPGAYQPSISFPIKHPLGC
jgi:hypothetical protein